MCGALGRFWRIRGHWREGREWCAQALKKDADAAPKDVRAKALITVGMMEFWLGETVAAEVPVEAALTLAREAGNRSVEAVALNNLSNLVSDHGDWRARPAFWKKPSRSIAMRGNRSRNASVSAISACHLIDQGDLAGRAGSARACAGLQPGDRKRFAGGDSGCRAWGGSPSGAATMQRARTLSAEALAIFRVWIRWRRRSRQTLALARICIACGEPETAARHLAEALGHQQEARSTEHRPMPGCHGRSGGQGRRLGKGCALSRRCSEVSAKSRACSPRHGKRSNPGGIDAACRCGARGRSVCGRRVRRVAPRPTESDRYVGLEWLGIDRVRSGGVFGRYLSQGERCAGATRIDRLGRC